MLRMKNISGEKDVALTKILSRTFNFANDGQTQSEYLDRYVVETFVWQG